MILNAYNETDKKILDSKYEITKKVDKVMKFVTEI